MLKRKIFAIGVLGSVLAVAGQCYAAGAQNPGSQPELKQTLKEAMAKNRQVTVKLKNGQVFVGKLSGVSTKDFSLIAAPRSGYWGTIGIAYDNVSSVKQHSATARILGEIGNKTLTVLKWSGAGVAVAVALPIIIPLFLLLDAFGALPSC